MASGMSTLIRMAEDMERTARRLPFPDGAVELIKVEYAKLGDLVRAQARVFGAYHDRCTDPVEGVPLPPPVMNAIGAIQTVITKSADVADRVTPLALKVCADRLAELDDRRNAMWDHSRNPGGSGA